MPPWDLLWWFASGSVAPSGKGSAILLTVLAMAVLFLGLGLMPRRGAAESVFQVDRVPFLDAAGQRGFQEYKQGLRHKAFAISRNGGWAWWHRELTSYGSKVGALKSCRQFAKAPCKVFAVNDRIVWEPSPDDLAALERARAAQAEVKKPPSVPSAPPAAQRPLEQKAPKVAEPSRARTPPASTQPVPSSEPSLGRDLARETQRLLTELGYDPGPIDGAYGRRTRRAIEAYQRDRGLAVDGHLTPVLLSRLRDDAARTEARQAPSSEAPAAELLDELEELD